MRDTHAALPHSRGDRPVRPLEGMLVLDFSTLLPGPLATLMLAEAGAEVIKIERAGTGDDMRGWEPRWGRDSAVFALLNRGKRSLALDLKDPADQARLAPLVARADIVVEQFRPGAMARLGLDYDSVRAVNPGVIYCSITGYGQSGPKRDVAGHDLNYMADTGLLALSMGVSEPVVPPALVADIGGGAYPAVMNILLALAARGRTGQGCRLDVAMTDNLFPFAFWAMAAGGATGAWPGNGTDLLTGGTARYGLYRTRDGRHVAAAPIEQRFWEVFCDVIGLAPELRDDSRDPAATRAAVAELIGAEDGATWAARFAGRDCCCNLVASLESALADPHHTGRGLFAHTVAAGGRAELTALPLAIDPAFRAAPGAVAAPELGGDNAALLGAASVTS